MTRSEARETTLPSIEVPIERFELACGAVLLVSRRPDSPVFAVQMHLRGGHSLDPRGREGVAMLTGALAEQGTRQHDEEQIAALLEPAAGHLSGGSNGISGQIVSHEWRLLLALFAELVTQPSFPRSQVALHKQRLLDRLLVERDDPRVQGEQLFRKLVYGDHWLGRPVHGSIASVRRIAREDLVAFHRANWCASRATIAVCGDVEPKVVARVLDKLLARWPRGAPLGEPSRVFPPRARRSAAFRAERQQVHVHLGHLGVERAHPDYTSLVVMDHVLGTGPGFTNRIAMKLRDELGLAYAVHASIHGSAGVLPGAFTAYIGTSPTNVRAAIDGFVREIRRIQDERVREDELETAKSYLIGSLALNLQRAARRAAFALTIERYALPLDHLSRLPSEYAAVTAADVQRVAREHLHPDRCAVAAAGPLDVKQLDEIVAGRKRQRATG